MTDYVHVAFNPPRLFREVRRCYVLPAKGKEDLLLPIVSTALETEDSPVGKVVTSAWLPRFIAEDRGLTATSTQGNTTGETMGRYDWFLLGAAMALIVRGGDTVVRSDVTWEADKIARKLMEATE